MSIHVALNHRTVYKFDRPVNLSPHVVRLRPAVHSRTPILAYSLNVKPSGHFLNWQQDPFGNWLARLVFPEKVTELSVEVDLIADMVTLNPFDFFVEDYAYTYPFTYKPELLQELTPYLEVSENGERLQAWLKGVDFEQPNTVLFLVALNQRLQQDIGYNIRMEPGVQSCEETLTLKRGSCRDTAWLLVQILRHLGLAARFVSGYLVQLTADQKALDGPSGPEADFTDLHAWTEVYLPGAGWVGLDPTSGLFAGEGHIPLACTPKPSSAAPIDGYTDKCEVTFEFSNTVTRIHEDPRVTKPYSDEQWAHILALGNQVEADLIRSDVRLTMGGEPTFVSIDDMDAPEWNSAALGEHKRALAGNLLRRLQTAFAGSGSALQFGQGKWYPGEAFPRWALSCFWRVDNAPIWKDPRWIADDQRDYGYNASHAQQFAQTLCRNLGLAERYLVLGYEDRLYYLWKEASQPLNVDWLTLNLRDSKHRNDLVIALQRGLDVPTGLEHYLQLVATIENTAAECQMPVLLEGYEPPTDPRLKSFKVTPDPGVIEVNIHPVSTWQELVHNTETLYEEARLARLGTEKFMLDGRHTGTGGGNHVTLGAATPADSPFLRQPDLLRSLLTYWQHHPGLSYLFSGMFIGPTSQAPRVDEARDEALYELEIAFQQMPSGHNEQPWLVDRLLRNLLIDVTGNTHRAEFCIDKLYSPDSYSGRQGLVEFRAFEMPPHARMSVVQMLLLRTLVARFWNQPYKHRLVRWGTKLHDRWMLPHYVWEDMRDVCEDLQAAGYPFQLEWFAPFHEFRFPVYGRAQYRGIQLELRAALEPWNVLGEELSNMGTARFVDSSIERLQIKINGLTDARYVVACNGRRVPLNPTGVQGEYVAGVRYRAWQPPSALHPTIGIHSPLVFDIIDTWTGRSIGGCTYHVVHPGGRSYDTFPVNAYEAEGRRFSRFREQHTPRMLEPKFLSAATREFYQTPPRPMSPPLEEVNAEYPYTLDLRRM